jgi:predicted porin
MKKSPRLLALPLLMSAASICTVASAQNSVSIYGRLYPYLNSEKASGATPAGTALATLSGTTTGPSAIAGGIKGMAAGNSNLGFKGKEDLGGGLQAEFQIEGTLAVDDGNAAGFTWNRNTFVGLTNNYGSIKLGLMDTVFKEYGDTIGVLGVSSGTPMSSSNILRKVSFGANNAARFHERRANSIRYDSPSLAGFEAGLQVATQENPNLATGIGPQKTYSFGVKWDNGPFYVALAHEIHDNWFGGSTNAPTAMRNNAQAGITSKDKATQFTLEWRPMKEHKFEFDVIKKSYNENANVTGRFQSYSNTAYLLAVESRWNAQWRTVAQIVKSNAGSCSRINAVCNTDGLEGSKLIVGGSYYLARRTYFFAVLDQMKNGKSGRFAANDFGAVSAGEDTRHLIAGLSHGF